MHQLRLTDVLGFLLQTSSLLSTSMNAWWDAAELVVVLIMEDNFALAKLYQILPILTLFRLLIPL